MEGIGRDTAKAVMDANPPPYLLPGTHRRCAAVCQQVYLKTKISFMLSQHNSKKVGFGHFYRFWFCFDNVFKNFVIKL